MRAILRYSRQDFPSYRFIAGENPHPTENPEGHSYRKKDVIVKTIIPEHWQTNEQYLYGVDLYNAGYWWESHEAFESLWRAAEAKSSCRDFLQGLIKISGAFLKWHLKKKKGLDYLYLGALEHLKRVEADYSFYMGIDLMEHVKKLNKHFSRIINVEKWRDPLENYPYIILNNVEDTQRSV